MPKYRVKELSLVGNELHQPGAVVEYDGLPAENLEPLDDEGRAKYQEYLKSNAERLENQERQYGTASAVGDPAAFMKLLAKDREEQSANIATAVATAVTETLARLFPAGLPVAAPTPVSDAPAPAAPRTGKGSKATDGPDSLV